MKRLLIAFALCVSFAALSASAATISGSMTFDSGPLGFYGSWSTDYSVIPGGAAGNVSLQSVSIDLSSASSAIVFDTTGLLGLDFVQTGGLAAYSSLIPGTAAGRDGAQLLTINFSSFGSNDGFNFDLDVDRITGYFLGIPITAQRVNASQIAGALITWNFVTAYGDSFSHSAELIRTGAYTAVASFSAQVVPEPGTIALMGFGLLAVGIAARRRRKA